MHSTDVVQGVKIISCHGNEYYQEVEAIQHFQQAPDGIILLNPEEGKVTWE